MGNASRESRLNAAFVMVADTLIADYDVVDLLHNLVTECVAIVDATAGGLMLADSASQLQLVASTSESANLVEVMQLAAGAGPCIRCFTTGTVVSIPDIAATGDQWPAFRDAAVHEGFLAVHSVPMRLRGDTLGTMNLFSITPGRLSQRDASAAQALADVATIGVLQERVASQALLVAEQLQRALDSRVLIEQAKGAISQATGASVDEAFSALRRYARSHNRTLRDVSQSIIDRSLDIGLITGQFAPPPLRRS